MWGLGGGATKWEWLPCCWDPALDMDTLIYDPQFLPKNSWNSIYFPLKIPSSFLIRALIPPIPTFVPQNRTERETGSGVRVQFRFLVHERELLHWSSVSSSVNENDNSYLIGLLWGLSEIMLVNLAFNDSLSLTVSNHYCQSFLDTNYTCIQTLSCSHTQIFSHRLPHTSLNVSIDYSHLSLSHTLSLHEFSITHMVTNPFDTWP